MKRPLADQKSAHKAHKRQKTWQSSQPPASNPKRRRVRLDDLQWRGVDMPDRLEDAEGLYGLEEIDDVVVVRDPTTGQISYETTKSEEDVAREKEQAERIEEETLHELRRVADGGEEEWEGFSDEDPATDDADENPEDEPIPPVKTRKDGTKKAKRNATENLKGAFDILADKPEEDDTVVDLSAWNGLGLSEEVLTSLSTLKFARPTTIQSSAIPEILAGRDVIGKASTGSGKTLAFGIPILEAYLASRSVSDTKTPLALIVSPTRELAHQLSSHLTALCSGGDFEGPSIATVTGGLSVQKQRRMLEKADIVVGTPGRLWEVISSGQGLLSSFKQIRFLVVDEADRLLSAGHYKELGQILEILDRDDEVEEGAASTPAPEAQRQTLVFSATFHKGLQQKLAGKGPKGGDLMSKQESMEYLLKKLNFREEKPKFIDANPKSQMATGLREGLIQCAGTEKDLFLYALLLFHPKKRSLIFTNSVAAVRRLTPFLQNLDLPALPLHSGMPQKARLRSVERFTERPGSILVATDVAARGLDIPGVQLIIHYHLPRAADTYVHRSGRTARAEASGSSILICGPEEVAGVRRLVAKVHAQTDSGTKKFIRTLDIDRRIVSRLKERATLSKQLADATIAKEKQHSADDEMQAWAEELGVDYDSETFENEAKGRRGRGSGRKKKEKEAREMTKREMQGLRGALKALLGERINVGVSAKYLTSGGIDVGALRRGEGNAAFLGNVEDLWGDEE